VASIQICEESLHQCYLMWGPEMLCGIISLQNIQCNISSMSQGIGIATCYALDDLGAGV
jgi:hypothetical protein